MSERNIVMKRWFRLTSVVLLPLVAAWTGSAQEPRPATHRTTLRQDTEIQGYLCAKGYAFLYANGRLEQCSVSREIAFGEAKLPVGSLIILLQDGRPKYAMLQHNAEVAGVKCRGGNRLLGPGEGAMTALYPSGKLEQCFLSDDEVVQGVPCRASSFLSRDAGVKLYEDGKLKSCTLAKDFWGKRRGERFMQVQ
jgi:antitoxin component YwqK of YwqJK toxin-antitoxin module